MTTIISGSNGLTFPDNSTQAVGFYGFKNRIINGGMVIDQRNAGALVSNANNGYTLDRWLAWDSVNPTYSVQQNSGTVTPPAGFTNYLGVVVTTARTPTSGARYSIAQPIEGYNVADLAYGTASAQTTTLSFWVRSSITGNLGGVIKNGVTGRGYPFNMTVNSPNTWEYKTVTISGDTASALGTANGVGMYVVINLGTGSSLQATAGAWSSGDWYAPTGCVNLVSTLSATFYITGVQLEKGSTATSFDYRPYGTELALCQRYYEKGYPQGTAPANGAAVDIRQWPATVYNTTAAEVGQIKFAVTKRAAPTATLYNSSGTGASAGQWSIYAAGWAGYSASAGTTDYALGVTLVVSALTNGSSYITSGGWAASAEL
jgi:hypothetical protein